jgi:hypothetical protein
MWVERLTTNFGHSFAIRHRCIADIYRMSFKAGMVFGFFLKKGNGPEAPRPSIPTVKFDASHVTMTIRADLWERVQEFEDLPVGEVQSVFEAAVMAAQRGRDAAHLFNALTNLGVSKSRASYISRYLLNRSTALMNVQRMRDSGITEGKWGYSGSPCWSANPPSPEERKIDAAHSAANRQTFLLTKGMLINGEWTFPGLAPACKCVTIAVVPGFD